MDVPTHIKVYLAALIDQDLEHQRNHLNWLASTEGANEEDHGQQVEDCAKMIDLGTAAKSFFLVF